MYLDLRYKKTRWGHSMGYVDVGDDAQATQMPPPMLS
jgi:hypothetical protein